MDSYDAGLWLCAAVAGYCFGCLDMAWFAGFLKGLDIKKLGNGNAGASNALMVLGVLPAAATAAWDIGKAVLAYLFLRFPFGAPREACLLAAAAAVVGHCFPFWLGFDGGKGFAPYIGFMLCMDWRLALLPIAVGAVLALAFDRIVLMTFACMAATPAGALLALGRPDLAAMSLGLSAVLAWRHRRNMSALLAGTEPGIRDAFLHAGGKKDKNGDT